MEANELVACLETRLKAIARIDHLHASENILIVFLIAVTS